MSTHSAEEPTTSKENQTKYPIYTDRFRDGKRRIDVVLVVKDEGDEIKDKLKLNFLMSIVKAGFELELEPGLIKIIDIYKNLIFVKVHAPDYLIEEYGVAFRMRKYFKDPHLEFVSLQRGFFARIFPFSVMKREREWIGLVRKQYVGPKPYSNYERSAIVYKYLLNLPFGDDLEFCGLEKLLSNNIINDAYALHDGPFFIVPGQDMSKTSSRQILYYNWVGRKNWYKVQPLDLIHEYFGEKVSFFFAFYEYYIQALMLVGAIGVLVPFVDIFDTGNDSIRYAACYDHNNTYVCPTCQNFRRCPFERLEDYCMTVTIINILDNASTFYFCLLTSIWAIVFVGLWKRKEFFWNWMWELEKTEHELRTVFMNYVDTDSTHFQRELFKIARIAISVMIFLACLLISIMIIAGVVLLIEMLKLKVAHQLPGKWGDYLILAAVGGANGMIIPLSEHTGIRIAYTLTKFENLRFEETFERSLVIKMHLVTFFYTFTVLIYYAWLKGFFYHTPHADFNVFWGLTTTNCGPFGCIHELWVTLTVTLIVKQIILKVANYTVRMKSDYSKIKGLTFPCWEREYRLLPMHEEFMMARYNALAMQFGLVTLFVAAFPLAPFLALCINIWDIRYLAQRLLLASRRPLLGRCNGIGSWRDIFVMLAYASALFNAITLVRTTNTIARIIYYFKNGSMKGFVHFLTTEFDTFRYLQTETHKWIPSSERYVGFRESFLKYEGEKPEKCIFPGNIFNNGDPKVEMWVCGYDCYLIAFGEILFVTLFQNSLMLLVMLSHYFIMPNSVDIIRAMGLEQRIKYSYQQTFKKTNVVPTKI